MDLNSVIYSDGQQFFDELKQKYRTHEKGLFIMTPSGAGKTYYCKNQSEQDWIDGDDLWVESGAQPSPDTAWWDKGVPVIERVEQRCDVITAQAIDRGFWVMGSVNFWLKPDAIVIPEWDVLIGRIKMRQESGEYDGGMTDAHHEQVRTHIRIISKWNTEHGVPKFTSIEDAVRALTNAE